MKTSAALICVRCEIPIRPFPAAVFDGSVILTAEVPFRNRLAYRCTRCDKFSCACCCHPPELVKAMMKPDAIGLPHDFSTPFPGAACQACRGMVRPFEQDEVEEEREHFDENEPWTRGRRVLTAFFAILMLSIGFIWVMEGAWIRGVLLCMPGGAMLFAAVFSK